MGDIPDDHPRSESLNVRHAIIEGMHENIVAEAGLIAHGRGEAFDYLLGEKTHQFAKEAIRAAAAQLYIAKKPVFSINGNVTVLCPEEIVEFSNVSGIPLEINLFYRRPERVSAIRNKLEESGAKKVLGTEEDYYEYIDEISSQRRIVDKRGIGSADTVFVPLEDGDRTEGLVKNNITVITVDLNPLSRTAQKAHITIVDNIIRVMPLLSKYFKEIENKAQAKKILEAYNNDLIIQNSLEVISEYWKNQAKK